MCNLSRGYNLRDSEILNGRINYFEDVVVSSESELISVESDDHVGHGWDCGAYHYILKQNNIRRSMGKDQIKFKYKRAIPLTDSTGWSIYLQGGARFSFAFCQPTAR